MPKTLNLTQRTREPVEACEQQRQGSTYELETSGWFISLLQFLSHGNRNLERWTKRCRTTGKLQLSSAQADRSFISPTLPEESSLSFLSVPKPDLTAVSSIDLSLSLSLSPSLFSPSVPPSLHLLFSLLLIKLILFYLLFSCLIFVHFVHCYLAQFD